MLLFSKPGPLDSLVGRCRGDSTGTSQPAAASPATVNEDGTTTLTLERQDISTVGKMAGLAPGTRSGLWAHMADAIETLQPEWVVIENVRGLLSAPAIRPAPEGEGDEQRNPTAIPAVATHGDLEPDPWHLGEYATRPLRAAGAVMWSRGLCGMGWQRA